MTRTELIAALKKQTFKQVEVYEPLDDDALKTLNGLKKDNKASVLVLHSQRCFSR
jgi:hypothetical protein